MTSGDNQARDCRTRQAILVLGMHRSGTSALTRALSLLGAALPKHVARATPSNEAGHWEPERLVHLHDEMLGEAGDRWDNWRAFDPSALGAARFAHYKAESLGKASYNGGFVVVRRTAGIFQQTESFFVQSVQAGLRPHRNRNFQEMTGHGVVTGIEAEFWGSSQACLSLAIWGRNLSVRILPPTHNFPLHNEGYVAEFGTQEPLVAIHYHHLFGGDQSHNPLLKGRLNVPSACLDWLARRLPIFE
jgi:hypothetical protein